MTVFVYVISQHWMNGYWWSLHHRYYIIMKFLVWFDYGGRWVKGHGHRVIHKTACIQTLRCRGRIHHFTKTCSYCKLCLRNNYLFYKSTPMPISRLYEGLYSPSPRDMVNVTISELHTKISHHQFSTALRYHLLSVLNFLSTDFWVTIWY